MNNTSLRISIVGPLIAFCFGGCDDFDPQEVDEQDLVSCPTRLGSLASIPPLNDCGEVEIQTPLVIDTSARTISTEGGGRFEADVVVAPDFMAIVGAVIRIGAGGQLRATGERALVLAAGVIELAEGSTVDVSAALGNAAGANSECAGGEGREDVLSNAASGGGGGGGLGGSGGEGGDTSSEFGRGGLGRAARVPTRLVGGCSGGVSRFVGGDPSFGGLGGGVVYLLADEIVVRGTIDAGGGGGKGGVVSASGASGGGGGGSGGLIILEAKTRTTIEAGLIVANGGGGGSGAGLDSSAELAPGADGADGSGVGVTIGGASASQDSFGIGGSGSGEDDDGFHLDGTPGSDGSAGPTGDALGGGGGGGGGAGVVHIIGELELLGGAIAPPPVSSQ